MDFGIRAELPGDAAAVRALLTASFGGEDEARLVEELRSGGHVAVALVACSADAIVGYVLFSDLGAEIDGQVVSAVALAPLAVRSDYRKKGVGARLVDMGLQQCRIAGRKLAVVQGDPAYYARFAFSTAAAQGLSCPFSGAYLQALELRPFDPRMGSGKLTYAPPFGRFS